MTETTVCAGCGAWVGSGQYHRNDCPTVAAMPRTVTANGTAPQTTVTIGSRAFRIGAIYSPMRGFMNRQLIGFDPHGSQYGGTVRSRSVGEQEDRWWCAPRWEKWAGEEVKT